MRRWVCGSGRCDQSLEGTLHYASKVIKQCPVDSTGARLVSQGLTLAHVVGIRPRGVSGAMENRNNKTCGGSVWGWFDAVILLIIECGWACSCFVGVVMLCGSTGREMGCTG